MGVPSDRNTSVKVTEKLSKYKDLEIETSRMWGMRTETIPVIRDLKQPGRVCGRRREKTSEVWVENVVQSGKNKCLSKLPSLLPSRLVAEVGRLH